MDSFGCSNFGQPSLNHFLKGSDFLHPEHFFEATRATLDSSRRA
jgi:hypothetical protein